MAPWILWPKLVFRRNSPQMSSDSLKYKETNKQKISKEMRYRNIKFCQTRDVISKNPKLNEDILIISWSCTRKWSNSYSFPPSLAYLVGKNFSVTKNFFLRCLGPFWSLPSHYIYIYSIASSSAKLSLDSTFHVEHEAGRDRCWVWKGHWSNASETWAMLVHYF